MPDQDFDDQFAGFRAGGPLVVPAGPAAARQVHRRRRRVRLAVGTAIAAALVAVPVAALAVDDGSPDRPNVTATGDPTPPGPTPSQPFTPTPPPAASSEPTDQPSSEATDSPPADPIAIPASAMLRNADVPDGYRFAEDDADGDWTLNFLFSMCDVPGPEAGPAVDTRERAFRGPNRDESVLERVERFPSTTGARERTEIVREKVDDCAQQEVVATGFAGDESFVVRTDFGTTFTLNVVVRQGGLVAEVWQKHLTDVDAARDLGRAAAERLCAGTYSC